MVFLAAESSTGSDPTVIGWVLLGLFCVGTALMLYCVFTIYRNPYFNEVHKLGWLLIALMFPLIGPLAWIVRSSLEKAHRKSNPYDDGHEDDVASDPPAYQVHRPSESAFFARSSAGAADRADVVTSDSPENPYITQRKDGTRGLTF